VIALPHVVLCIDKAHSLFPKSESSRDGDEGGVSVHEVDRVIAHEATEATDPADPARPLEARDSQVELLQLAHQRVLLRKHVGDFVLEA
jgi:hypothetical protein